MNWGAFWVVFLGTVLLLAYAAVVAAAFNGGQAMMEDGDLDDDPLLFFAGLALQGLGVLLCIAGIAAVAGLAFSNG